MGDFDVLYLDFPLYLVYDVSMSPNGLPPTPPRAPQSGTRFKSGLKGANDGNPPDDIMGDMYKSAEQIKKERLERLQFEREKKSELKLEKKEKRDEKKSKSIEFEQNANKDKDPNEKSVVDKAFRGLFDWFDLLFGSLGLGEKASSPSKKGLKDDQTQEK